MNANNKQIGGSHYQTSAIQHWDFTWENRYNQFEYCVTKYVDRHRKKKGIEDVEKALHHCEKFCEVYEPSSARGRWSKSQLLAYCESKNFDEYQTEIHLAIHSGEPEVAKKFIKEYLEELYSEPTSHYTNPDQHV